MQDLLDQLVTYLRGMWHRRWIGVSAAWLAAIVGVAIVYQIPEKYEARARVYVDTESLLRPLLAGLAVQPNVEQQVSLISRTLISRPNVEKLIRAADLDLGLNTPQQRDEMIDDVMRTIKLEGNVSTNLYIISYRDPQPARARTVVQSLLTIFVESTLGDKRQDTQAAVKFLDEQIKRYDESLRASENRLKEFRLKYLGVANKDGSDFFARASQMQSDIEAARLDLQSAEQSRDAYKKQLDEGIPATQADARESAENAIASPVIDARLDELKKTLDTLLLKYTDQHPDVLSTRRLIAQLEEERKADLEARRKALAAKGPKAAVDSNPVLQQFRVALAEADANVAAAKAKLAGLETQQRTLMTQARMVPEIEAQFTQLNRDYDVQKQTYHNLLARRESALMGKDVQDTGGAQFRVIDPPRVSPEPVAPRRLTLLGVACGLALLLGLAASFGASQLAPTVHDARSLRDVAKRPILGMVSLLPSPEDKRRRRWNNILFTGAMSSLLAALTAVVAFALLIGRAA
jgi:polysaccharide chain length determinant protein (PEP-CTERM system associated)